MTKEEIVQRLRSMNRKQVSRDTGIRYGYLNNLVYGEIANPGHAQIDKLRSYLIAKEVLANLRT